MSDYAFQKGDNCPTNMTSSWQKGTIVRQIWRHHSKRGEMSPWGIKLSHDFKYIENLMSAVLRIFRKKQFLKSKKVFFNIFLSFQSILAKLKLETQPKKVSGICMIFLPRLQTAFYLWIKFKSIFFSYFVEQSKTMVSFCKAFFWKSAFINMCCCWS